MLRIAQVGEAGKTKLLFDMHRLRKRVFKDRMGWDVSIDPNGLEVDQFDLPETVYLLSLNDDNQIIGSWRLNPTSGPTMIRDVWPQFLQTIDMPSNNNVWETSRFSVDSTEKNVHLHMAQVSRATQELFCGLTELCLMCGIREIYTMYDMRIARLLKRVDCEPYAISKKIEIAGNMAQVGAFRTDREMLSRLQTATGIAEFLVEEDMLPPILQEFRNSRISKAAMISPSERILETECLC